MLVIHQHKSFFASLDNTWGQLNKYYFELDCYADEN